jgi:hypothetical protein
MKIRILFIAIILLLVTGCNGTFEVGLEPSKASANNQAATITPAIIPTERIVTPVPTVPELQPTSETPVEGAFPTSLPTPRMVEIYLIALEDNGQSGIAVGCGDSAVPVQVQIEPTQGVLKAALEALLAIKVQYYGQSGLYNALYQSDLQVESVKITDENAEVHLTGSLILGGECDNPRVQAQLEQTILQFSTVSQASVYINGKTLADALSLKGN